jgi:hypothetical protein
VRECRKRRSERATREEAERKPCDDRSKRQTNKLGERNERRRKRVIKGARRKLWKI